MSERLAAERWDGCCAADLAGSWGVPAVHLFERLGSTNDVARELADGGAASGTAVLANEQRAGRGQAGRTWSSAPGLGVWLSLVLRPTALPDPAVLPLATGLRIAHALDAFTGGVGVTVKWPNDLLVNGRKIGGILCEAVWQGNQPAFVVVGVGVNALHGPGDFPPEVRRSATSLALASGCPPARRDVAKAVAQALIAPRLTTGDWVDQLRERDALAGKLVVVTEAGDADGLGTALGIAADGALLVRSAAGSIQRLRRGTVRLADAPRA